ncbi:MFS transporter [Curtanaerobium respiraculi]|uniref:MFS transporter n=1 Tax=Curtanaerobium respiraculi TaxID=2949669 RepID=UPI0024B3400C|nr:MFS transporter [Curtanaerobium respiraculi]
MEENAANGNNYFDGMVKLSKPHKHFLWIAAVCYFFDQMNMQMFGYITPAIMTTLNFTLDQIAQMNSLTFLGMCLGGFLGGWMGTKLGRKNSLLILVTMFSIASFINTVTSSFAVFMLCRFLTGFGTLGMVTVAMVYMSEMLPSTSRGKYQALSISCGTLGIPFGALFTTAMLDTLGDGGWRACFLVGCIGIIILPIGLKWLRESLRWLVMRGRVDEAEAIVSECTEQPCDLSVQASRFTEEKTVSMGKTIKMMFGSSLRKQTIVVTVLSWGATLGVFYLASYGVTFMVDLGLPYSIVLIISAFGVIGTPLGDVAVSFFSDKGGRRIPIIIMACIAGVTCVITGIVTGPMADAYAVNGSILITIFLVVLGILRALFSGGTMTLMWTYLAESFPTKIRSNATGLVFGSARLVAVPVTLTVPATYLASGYLGVNIVNALWYFIPALFALLFGINSAQKSLEELEEEAEALANE